MRQKTTAVVATSRAAAATVLLMLFPAVVLRAQTPAAAEASLAGTKAPLDTSPSRTSGSVTSQDDLHFVDHTPSATAALAAGAKDATANTATEKLKDAVSYPIIKITGFFQADVAWFGQDQANRDAIVNGARLGDIQDGADFRRTRLAAVGDVAENVGYMIEMDFAFPGRPSFMDVLADIRGIPLLGTFRVGQYRQPVGLDEMTSIREVLFLERALPFAFTPFRQIGAGFFNADEELGVTWFGSVFRFPTDFFGGNVGDNGGWGVATRGTWLAFEGEHDTTLHLGGSYTGINPANNLARFRNQPELFVGENPGSPAPIGVPSLVPFFVDTRDIRAADFHLFGTELAGTRGPLFFQSELMIVTTDRISNSNVTFWGAYAQAAWCLTGEARPYSKKNGVYTRIVPKQPFHWGAGFGAWEAAARWSIIDLNDDTILGNQLTNWTLGLNWYLNRYMKFQFNYIHSVLDSGVTSTSEADIFAARAQLDF